MIAPGAAEELTKPNSVVKTSEGRKGSGPVFAASHAFSSAGRQLSTLPFVDTIPKMEDKSLGRSAMSLNSSDVLRHLFGIPQSQICRDIDQSRRDLGPLMTEDFSTFLAGEEMSINESRAVAVGHHRRMVRAKVINELSALTQAYRLYCVSMAANDVATEAVFFWLKTRATWLCKKTKV